MQFLFAIGATLVAITIAAWVEKRHPVNKGKEVSDTPKEPSTGEPVTKRKEEFLPDGKRIRTTSNDVANAWQKYTSRIPVNFATGTAYHESSFTLNEKDTEPSGFESWGVFQLSKEEAKDAGSPNADLLALDDSAKVFARISESRLDKLLSSANLSSPKPDVWAYLALAHNQGLSAALKSIATYGLDWEKYKARNPGARINPYGDDAIKGKVS